MVCDVHSPGDVQGLGPGAVKIGAHRAGPLPTEGLEIFDTLLTYVPDAPRPWVSAPNFNETLDTLRSAAHFRPIAAVALAQILRSTLKLSFEEAVAMESVAYSMLLATAGFRAWRNATPRRERAEPEAPRVLIDVGEDAIGIRLNRPARRNAFDAAMRDALCEALGFALEHPDGPPVVLTGEGPAFSAGGDLDEFGAAEDVGWAHLIRTVRSPATLAHELGARLTVRLHGACVGAGIEVPAAAGHVVARAGAFFRLPEVSMGLIPGAGGTVTIPRRIGRHRTCYMALSGADIDLPTALAWGLVDAVEDDT